MLTNLQSTRASKIARKTALETELKNLSAEIEADDKKIAELPGLIEKTQEEASSAITEANQCEAELTVLSNTQKDYQEWMRNIHQTISNTSNVIAKYFTFSCVEQCVTELTVLVTFAFYKFVFLLFARL
jgi:chromosome segregation ATPase